MSFPYTNLPSRETIIAEAAKHNIHLEPDDFTEHEVYGWCLDEMPAAEWLEAQLS